VLHRVYDALESEDLTAKTSLYVLVLLVLDPDRGMGIEEFGNGRFAR
jgi:hypothetical protein